MTDRRDGVDRREDEQGITLGEVYRLCERIDGRMSELRDDINRDVHSLRSKIDANNVTIELLKLKVAALEAHGRDWRGWVAAAVIAAVTSVIAAFISHRL